jgi:solute carrier family 35, member E1
MTTTTVLSPSPTRLSFPPLPPHRPSPSRQSMDNAKEQFPPYEDLRPDFKPNTVINSSPSTTSSPVGPWPARRSSPSGRDTKKLGGLHRHRPKRSVGEAFDNFRQRRGSISANTQDLAEALRAPISYKLIVSLFIIPPWTSGCSY